MYCTSIENTLFLFLVFLHNFLVEASQIPNFLLIVADDLGYGEVESFSVAAPDRTIDTPNLMKLASEGMLFTDAYAGSPVCAPSRTTLFTGLHTGMQCLNTKPIYE